MTLNEVLHQLENPNLQSLCQCVLFYRESVGGMKSATVGEIKADLKNAGFRKQASQNISKALGDSGPRVHIAGKNGRSHLWSLTSTGKKHVGGLVSIGSSVEPVNDAVILRDLLKTLDKESAEYIAESIKCFEADARNASVLFLWAGAVRCIQEQVAASSKKALDAAVTEYAPKAPKIRKPEHLAYVQEASLLLIAEVVGIFDRNERAELEKCLDLRNRCGHPGKYKPGPKKVSSFIEDVSVIVFGATHTE